MNATDILKEEHRVIEQVLECLAVLAEQSRQTGRLDGASARLAIDFFRHFADGCHHHKEEQGLFPALERKGFPRQGGPTGVMLGEHEQGRQNLQAMAAVRDAAAAGDPEAVERFATEARRYVELLRQHIQKEDHCLFPMSERVFSAQEQQELLESFHAVEHDDVGPGMHEKYLAIADELATRFGVSPTSCAVSAGHGCCHHG
jgi:hemerythrin-like domain-containing protein